MVFQDFDQISERRRLERARKFRQRVIITVVLATVIILLIGAAVFIQVSPAPSSSSKTSNKDGKSKKHPKSNADTDTESKDASSAEKMIVMICNSTDYKEKCESILKDGLKANPKSSDPKELIKLAITAAAAEVKSALKKATNLKFATPEEKGAFEDCKVLMEDAVEELEMSMTAVSKKNQGKLTEKATPDLNNWLSAVMSYHETCVDGFPDGSKMKHEMEKIGKSGKELTSNSLAMISQVATFFSKFESEGPGEGAATRRRLMDQDELPSWMDSNERRMLKSATAGDKPTPNVVVAQDGSGNFKTINEALAAMPAKYDGRYVIYLKEGIYEEAVVITKKMVNVTMYGDGSQKSMISGNKNFADGVRTFQTASFVALGDGFFAQAIGFRNTAGPEKHQAVAARVQADRAIFLNCRFDGYQDTLYAQAHRQFYRSCLITGTIDFIFGDAAAIFQNCNMMVKKPLDKQQNIVTAQGRSDRHETTAIVLQRCKILPDKTLEAVKSQFKSYLGRPWKEYSRTIVMESTIEDIIHPDGWLAWEGDFALKTLYYAEFNNDGPGAKTEGRVKWPGHKVIDKEEAAKFTIGSFLEVDWIQSTSAPVHVGLF
ncbi:putative pectinesterase/pectinesterase inhibitor 45 [Cucurbita pepo subsp. pepo]|uniref:putative pectinesterase/pectinesterase inhibitor 45 n=1 Tax=Cucurbita pepo subsp. pepo TaxID=3664 RepID=UPI000C9DA16C|nr:putative pectinesterase/pectinesterase inhibitor 45 [Cucurbita pepo subsp. pepo]